MIDIVIPHVLNRFWPEKLQYVLRSFELHFKEEFNMHIIGHLPATYKNIGHIPFHDDLTKHTEYNLGKKLKIAAARFDRFIWTYDDIYLLQPMTLEDIAMPRVNEYLALYSMEQRRSGPWFDLLWKTFDRCLELGLPGFSFETHLPYFFESGKLQKALNLFNIERGEHLAKSAYSNLYFPGRENLVWDHEKVVFYAKEDFDRNPHFGKAKFLNHNATGLTKGLQEKIKSLFPEKSRFEA